MGCRGDVMIPGFPAEVVLDAAEITFCFFTALVTLAQYLLMLRA
jgi:hypothetical protein